MIFKYYFWGVFHIPPTPLCGWVRKRILQVIHIPFGIFLHIRIPISIFYPRLKIWRILMNIAKLHPTGCRPLKLWIWCLNAGLVATKGLHLMKRGYCSTIAYHSAVLPTHGWHLMIQSLLKTCMESRTSVSGQFPANARCLHLKDGPTQRIFIWPLSGESKLYPNDVDMSRNLQVPSSLEAPCTRCGSLRCISRIEPFAGGGFCIRRLCNGGLVPCRTSLGVEWDPE